MRGSGFSIVELLVVLGVITLLTGIILPATMSVRSSARTTQCQANLRQLGVALLGYANANNGYFPGNSATSGTFWYLDRVLGSHLSSPLIVSRSGEVPANAQPDGSLAGGVFVCPNDLDDSVRSYSMNLYASSELSPRVQAILDGPDSPGVRFRLHSRAEASKLLLLVESWSELPVAGSDPLMHTAQAIVGFRHAPAQRFGGAGGFSWPTPPDATPGRFEDRRTQIDFSRHRSPYSRRSMVDPVGRANFLFADGHVDLIEQRSLMNAIDSRSSYYPERGLFNVQGVCVSGLA
jgi:prepilin-type processing-associated H-X9-DG protein